MILVLRTPQILLVVQCEAQPHLTKKSFTKFSKNDTPISNFFSVIQRSFFSFVVSVFFGRHSLFRSLRLMVGEELMIHSCFILITILFSKELIHLGLKQHH